MSTLNQKIKHYAQEDVYCTTHAGRKFFLNRPEFHMDDIAHALSNLCRYNGHCRMFYSVAEHSVLVSLLMEELQLGCPVEGLLHDATEAYLSDIPGPFKQLLPDITAADAFLETEFRRKNDLPMDKTEGCQKADEIALYIEGHYLFPHKGEEFTEFYGMRDTATALIRKGWRVTGLTPDRAKVAFAKRYAEVCGVTIPGFD